MLRMPTDRTPVLTTAEAAAYLGKSIAQVNRYASDGRLPVFIQAGGRVYRRQDVEDFAAELAAEHDGGAA
jgi:hypothetical protein